MHLVVSPLAPLVNEIAVAVLVVFEDVVEALGVEEPLETG